MISYKTFFQLMIIVFKKKNETYSYPLYSTIVLGLYLKQHLFQNELQRTGLEPR